MADRRLTDPNVGVLRLQSTLKAPIHCTGIGLHTGRKICMTLRPAAVDSGIVFVRSDLPADRNLIPASWDRVVDTRLCTILGNEHGSTVSTVEHLMAALAGCGIDNALVEVDGPEVPIMDGSSAPFVFLVECAGIVQQSAPRRAIRIVKPVGVEDGNARAWLTPGTGFACSFKIDFASAAIDRQKHSLSLSNGVFKREIAGARTFGFLKEVEHLRAHGYALGGSLENAVVIDEDRIVNAEGLRFDDEFVRHKILDSVGDLYLAGAPIMGHFHGYRSGHGLNNRLLRALFADRQAWRYVLATDETVTAEDWPEQAFARSA